MKQRTILFKGLRMDGEGWVEGGVLNGLTIIKVGKELDRYSFISVHPETISQYTGLKDKSGGYLEFIMDHIKDTLQSQISSAFNIHFDILYRFPITPICFG